jgi:concentrative nucleoside transporter, CNT family
MQQNIEKEEVEVKAETTVDVKPVTEVKSPNVNDEPVYKPKIGKRPGELYKDLAIWGLLTAFIIGALIKGREKSGFTLACVIYVFVTMRYLARHVSMSQTIYPLISRGVQGGGSMFSWFPMQYLSPVLLAFTFGLLVLTALLTPVGPSTSIPARIQSLIGIVTLLVVMYATSRNRSKIPWQTVSAGMLMQYCIAIFVLKTQVGQDIFGYLSQLIADFMAFSLQGSFFIFGPYIPNSFAKSVLPAIVFFCSFIHIVYYWGGMQYLIVKLAWLFVRVMDTSGAESCVACASPFVGPGESAMLVSPFLEYMTHSEIHATMTCGFATIAGSVLIFYLNLVRDPKTILVACVMSVPAALLLSKMRYPETEESITKGESISIPEGEGEKESNFLHAATNGSAVGMQLIILISGSLLAVVALFAACDFVVGWAFEMFDIYDWITPVIDGEQQKVSIALVLSYAFAPIAWLLGMPFDESRKAGEIMAIKMVVNEFDAYLRLNAALYDPDTKERIVGILSDRSADLLSFALCGFANVASMGIQIGGLSALAPRRTNDFAKIAFSAMMTGSVSTWLTASVAGSMI